MGLQCGIVGLPNVGKSTLFNCLSNARAQAANFPFCTIEPNVGVITVPDERLNKLVEIVVPKSTVPTTIEIVDIAGLVKGASKGEGLGNQFLANIRSTNAIIHVLRCFDNDNVIHVDGSVDPIRDKEIIDTELQLKDLDSIEKKISKVEKMAKTGGDKEAKKTFDVLTVYKNHLLSGKSARTAPVAEEDKEYIADIWLLTAKPVMYVCNVEESAVNTGNPYVEKLKASVKEENAEVLIISAQIESEIAQLESYEERQMFLEDLGLTESGVNKLIKAAYKLLSLATYFTAGVQEVRAWTITKGFTAPQAAGVIHTDFEKGFIRAEVIKYEDFVKFNGSEAVIKDNGKLAVEGKTYIVQDGDIMHFRFNV
jgi:GTP-binding protein YchF